MLQKKESDEAEENKGWRRGEWEESHAMLRHRLLKATRNLIKGLVSVTVVDE